MSGSQGSHTTISGSGPEACSDPSFGRAATPITMFFMLLDANDIAVASDSWSGSFKLQGPTPPDQLTLTAGDGQLGASFLYTPNLGDTTIDGYTFYCDPPPGSTSGAATAADGGALDCDNTPMTQALTPGVVPAGLDGDVCGQASRSVTSANLAGLTNGVPYRVALAATDTFGNVGPLSKVACAVPSRQASSQSSSTEDENVKSCSFSPPPARSSLGLLSLIASALALTIRFARSNARARCRAKAPSH